MEGQAEQNLSVFLPTLTGALEALPDFKIEVGIGSSAPVRVGRETLEGSFFALTRSVIAPPRYVVPRKFRADLRVLFY